MGREDRPRRGQYAERDQQVQVPRGRAEVSACCEPAVDLWLEQREAVPEERAKTEPPSSGTRGWREEGLVVHSGTSASLSTYFSGLRRIARWRGQPEQLGPALALSMGNATPWLDACFLGLSPILT